MLSAYAALSILYFIMNNILFLPIFATELIWKNAQIPQNVEQIIVNMNRIGNSLIDKHILHALDISKTQAITVVIYMLLNK